MKRSIAPAVVRDVASFVLGSVVILHQEFGHQSNKYAWGFGLACILGLPGVNAAIGLWRGNPERGGTTKPSSTSSPQDLPG